MVRRLRWMTLATLVSTLSLALLAPNVAHAELSGPCQAQATISGSDGGTYDAIDPQARTGVYVVPISGSANYTGSIAVQPPPAGRAISGSVQVALPLGGSVSIKSWRDDDATSTSDAGVVTWDLPDATPRGIEMTVSGSHGDLQNCTGAITVKLDGGLTDSVTGVAAAVLTVVAAAGVLFAAVPSKPL